MINSKSGTCDHMSLKKNVESNDRFQAIFHGLNDAILIHEKETGRILEANQKAGEMFGYSLEETGLIGINALSSGKPPYNEKHAVALIKKASAGDAQIFEWQARHKTGQLFWVEVNLKRATIGAEDHILATLRDITERKATEEKREALITELQEALDNIKTLKGLLPICSYCKKIRNDQGYWDNLEIYIEAHSEAQFSHGLCPDCLDKVYGDQEWYIKRRKERI